MAGIYSDCHRSVAWMLQRIDRIESLSSRPNRPITKQQQQQPRARMRTAERRGRPGRQQASAAGALHRASENRHTTPVPRTLCSMGINATGTLRGRRSSAEDARIEAPYAARGVGSGRGCAPFQKICEFFISKWCDMVHSGCVVFKIHWAHCR